MHGDAKGPNETADLPDISIWQPLQICRSYQSGSIWLVQARQSRKKREKKKERFKERKEMGRKRRAVAAA